MVFHHTELKYDSLVGISYTETKERVPHVFTLDGALKYMEGRRGAAISRGYDIARIHIIDDKGQVGHVHKTFRLDWTCVDNNTLALRHV